MTSLGMILRTRNIFNRLITKQPVNIRPTKSKYPTFEQTQPSQMPARTSTYDYVWEIRELSVKSPIGYSALLVGISNYVCSMIYISHYMDYSKLVESYGFNSEECEISSAFVIVSYCCLF